MNNNGLNKEIWAKEGRYRISSRGREEQHNRKNFDFDLILI
jgi:hypothetical protein